MHAFASQHQRVNMNGIQKHVDYTPLKPLDRSDDELAGLEACLWFDIGKCGLGIALLPQRHCGAERFYCNRQLSLQV